MYEIPLEVGGTPLRKLFDRDRLQNYEGPSYQRLMERVRPEDVVFEAGCYVGLYTLRLAELGAHVHAFEPSPPNRELLTRSIRANFLSDKVTVLPKAVTSGAHTVVLSAEGSKSSTIPSALSSDLESWRVPGVSLDDYSASGPHLPNVMKIDVEGAELRVLQGARRCLHHCHAVSIEVHPRALHAQGSDSRQVYDLMEASGFKLTHEAQVPGSPNNPIHTLWEAD